MAHSANYLKNKAETNLSEQDSPKKEHHRNHRHHNNRSHPRKTQDDGSRNTRGRDHSKRNRDPERDAGREIHEEKRSRVRDAHNHGYRMREDEHRMEREYRKRENRDHLYKREREHHSQTYENTSHSKRQPNYRNEKEIPDNGQIYRHKNYIETVSPEYVVTEDKRSEMHYFKQEDSGEILNCYRCRYLCTNRGLCQLVEVLLNLLILVCGAISYSGTGGYTDLSSLGSLYYYTFGSAYSGFQGAEAEKVKELDVAFYELKLPAVIATMAYSGALMSLACLLLVLGLARIPWQFPFLMIIECALDIAIALGYIPAVYFYFQHLIEGYNSQVCKERESMYKSKGYEGFNCSLHGADIVGGLSGCLAVIVYLLNAAAAILAFKKVRRLKGSREGDYVEGINV
ncbi:MARVEL domain-containing protein 3-like isoform X1 [Pristis pectinata]|uniref:MARVEL domain-containing protein 3-like isoform X1 n=1 Tax=Pristis pectinata TaxID=685728 RepID=UPI00223D59B6|nr:MARVEL domain-containing protein 3-like isoform X1 [Pristis pectinata]XP_051884737.1 MARVEL domain-containing protein 3-like isoform X1 [Pristis pectinata]